MSVLRPPIRIFIAILLPLLLICGFVVARYLKDSEKYVRGEIIIWFKPGVSENEAAAVLKKYFISVPKDFYRYNYIPFESNDKYVWNYEKPLKQNPLVESVSVFSNVSPNVKPWLVVTFTDWLTLDQIKTIIKPYPALSINPERIAIKNEKIKVLFGLEKFFAEKLSQEPKVQGVMLNELLSLTSGMLPKPYTTPQETVQFKWRIQKDMWCSVEVIGIKAFSIEVPLIQLANTRQCL